MGRKRHAGCCRYHVPKVIPKDGIPWEGPPWGAGAERDHEGVEETKHQGLTQPPFPVSTWEGSDGVWKTGEGKLTI